MERLFWRIMENKLFAKSASPFWSITFLLKLNNLGRYLSQTMIANSLKVNWRCFIEMGGRFYSTYSILITHIPVSLTNVEYFFKINIKNKRTSLVCFQQLKLLCSIISTQFGWSRTQEFNTKVLNTYILFHALDSEDFFYRKSTIGTTKGGYWSE